MGTRRGTLFVCLLLMTGACGDDGAPGGSSDASSSDDGAVNDAVAIDATLPADARVPDAMTCPAPGFGAIGGNCVDDGDCTGVNSFCVDEEEDFPTAGYCTRGCVMDADCDAGSACVDLITAAPFTAFSRPGGPPDKLCLPTCCAGDTCGTGLLCQNTIAVTIPLDKSACVPGNGNSTDHDACDSFGQCNVGSVCILGPETPGGMCAQFNCTVGDNTTCTVGDNSLCLGQQVGGPGGCVKQCDMDSQCREAEGYKCLSIGALSVCAHPGFGDSCGGDSDCGISPWTCDTAQPGGYCTTACDPAGSDCGDEAKCFDPIGGGTTNAYCVNDCMGPGQGTCRPGYSCNGGSCMPTP